MNPLIIDRRQLLKMGLSTSLLAALPLGSIILQQDDASQLLQFISDSSLPVDPQRTGSLSEAGFKTLSGLCTFVNRGWELTPDLSPYLARLRADLALKTRQEPSYLTEYEHAIDLIELLVRRSETVAQAWTHLLFAEFQSDGFAHTKLGRARSFVFAEIITHQVPLSGGFKSFGLTNYRGYFGGSYTLPASYRRIHS